MATAKGNSPLKASMAHMAAVVEKLASGTSTIAQAAQAKDSTPTMYTTYKVAVIKGFCGLRETNAIPVIWALFQIISDIQAHRGSLVEHRQADEGMVSPTKDQN